MKFDKSNSYSDKDILRMQQDAIARVREMQRRAQNTIDETNSARIDLEGGRRQDAGETTRGTKEAAALSLPLPEKAFFNPGTARESGDTAAEHHPKRLNGIGSMIKNLNLNSEDLLIIALIILLTKEEADISLIVALVYLLL